LPSLTLNNGQRIPIFGLGTWKSQSGQVEAAVKHAIDCGYTHIDCAPIYGNETEVGDAIKEKLSEGVITRSQLFVTSKLWNSYHHKDHVKAGLIKTLQDLQLDYLDLFLMHWPHGFQAGGALVPKDDLGNVVYDDTHFTETWLEMEKLVAEGLVKSIGISNFNSQQIQRVLDAATIKPCNLQIEVNPTFNNERLVQFAQINNMVVSSYAPLGAPGRPWKQSTDPCAIEDPVITGLASKRGKSPAQVILRWHLQRGLCVCVKSLNADRIKQNLDVFDFELSAEEMSQISGLNQNFRLYTQGVTQEHPEYPFKADF